MSTIRFRILMIFALLISAFILPGTVLAQTTGKIAGKVTDGETREALIGANVIIEGTNLGAATGPDGEFYIINLPPGTYTLKVMMIGYETVRLKNVQVSVNRTTPSDVKLKSTLIEGQEVVIEAEKIVIKKDQTSSVRNVSADQIDMLPVENMNAVINLQAGVVDGHFRGGRTTEVAYLIDGVEVTESFGGAGRSVDLEPESIQDLEVITGTFNAEYGNAMSGIVNAVTKDGGQDFHGSVSANMGNYYTAHDNIFLGLKESEFDRNQDYKLQLSGPIWGDRLSFFANMRYQDNKNHLNGIHRFNVDDFSYFLADDSTQWYSEHNGDNSYVPMDRDEDLSAMGKISFKVFSNLRLSVLYTFNKDHWRNYDHGYKYNPDGMASSHRETNMYTFNLNHMLSPKLFYELKVSYLDNYNGWYAYENPLDTNYVHDAYYTNAGPGFFTGGQDKSHSRQSMIDRSAKFDLTWQINKTHSTKAGFEYTQHALDRQWSEIRNEYSGMVEEGEFYFDPIRNKIVYPNYKPKIYPDASVYSDIYQVKPLEYSIYVQDKMEFNEMVINLGLRYDYFHPKSFYPSQRRNPANQLSFPDNPEKMSEPLWVDAKYQISPRFGLAYQLGKTALLHFSYGHFFQMPPMYAMYQNHSLQVAPTDFETTMGDPQIKAQKTVQYEIGLWQELIKGMGVEVIVFYRDIYDLLSAKVFSTFNQIEYGLYSNKDYGNVKGIELKYDFTYQNLSAFLNYTLQYTRGNADNPTQTFDRAGDSMGPINRLIPMSWDQRHTLNLTVGYNTSYYGGTLTGYFNSGAPYTWSPIAESILSRVNLYPNNAFRPARYSVDFNGFYDLSLMHNLKVRFSLSIYNLLDQLNEEGVNSQTGRAYTAIIRESNLLSHRSNFNEYIDRVQNPAMYSTPRMIKLGLGVLF
ncbi:TonB-dependent receptor [candidate division KSB1 bacterium]|nr:TonB-dependent receptor [candidate division KSB1 bacterium]